MSETRQNHLLATLGGDGPDFCHQLELVTLADGQVLHEPGGTLQHAYFPTTAIVSLLYVVKDGSTAEVAMIGNDGMVGASLFMGGDTAPSRALVLNGGQAYRLKAGILRREFAVTGPMQSLLLRYGQALIAQMAQTAVCNRHHSVDQQLCRWLLLSLDRRTGNEIPVTQELIANMLGVRREGITESARKLRKARLIDYSRGRIHVLDRAGLEARACECYAAVKSECDRLLPQPRPAWDSGNLHPPARSQPRFELPFPPPPPPSSPGPPLYAR